MGAIKDRNGKDLQEAEGVKNMWQENTENYTKKVLDGHDGVVTHREPDIL